MPRRSTTSSLLDVAARSSIGIATVDEDGAILGANDAFGRLVGTDRTTEPLPSLVDVVCALDPGSVTACLDAIAAVDATSFPIGRGETTIIVGELVGGWRDVLVDAGSPCDAESLTAIAIDAARRDPLTGLGNRRLVDEILVDWPDASPLGLLIVDLDRFKTVNDTLGHGAGDKLLTLASDRIRSAVRRHDDRVIRLGGDEFVVLHMPDGDAAAAEKIAERIVEFVGRPFLIDGQQVNVGASIGISARSSTTTTGQLLQHADLALYAAKDAGRGCFRMFEPRLEASASQRRDRELRLRRAMSLRELSLVYQPQVHLPDREVCGFEALLRWNSPELGHVPPDEFIPIAEEIGEIHTIGAWVLKEACAEAMTWPGDLVVGVNVSAVQFARDGFLDVVESALDRSGLAPHRLELEITESVLLDDSDAAVERLWDLRRLGVRIAMDDFGTGYSSLSYLNSFPFSAIKIDQSFVRGEQTDRSRTLVRAILALGSSLGMTTIAEGVETHEQFERLALEGCVEVQGYLFSRPMPPCDIAAYLDNPIPSPEGAPS